MNLHDLEAPGSRRVDLAVCVLLAAAVLAVYGRTAGFDFIPADDEGYVYGNPAVRRGLTAEGVRYAFASLQAANWHPVTWLSHMADVSLFGLSPGGHHAVNVLLHGANALLLYSTLVAMTGERLRCAFVAAAFAVHPLNVESVAWVCERKNLLCLLFLLLSLRSWTGWARGGSRRSWAASLAFHALALMAKPMAVTTPFLLLLLDGWPFRRLAAFRPAGAEEPGAPPPVPVGRLLVEKLPFLLLSAASSAVTLAAQAEGGALGDVPLPLRLANAVRSLLLYLRNTAWPEGLSFFYPYPDGPIPPWETAAGAALLLAASAAAVRWRRTLPWLPAGWFWFLGTLVPMIGVVQAGRQAMADRYMYLPGTGLFLLLAWGSGEGAARLGRRWTAALPVLAAALLLGWGGAAWRQGGYWKDEVTLLTRALALDPDNAFAHQNLASALAEKGDHAGSLRHQREALRIEPGNPKYAVNLAAASYRAGRPAEAEALLREVEAAYPEYVRGHVELGRMLALRGAAAEAAAEFRHALLLEPGNGEARRGLGEALARSGEVEEALPHLREALRIEPGSAASHRALGDALARGGRLEEGAAHLREAVRIEPGNAEGWHRLGAALDGAGRFQEAAASYRKSLSLRPESVPTRLRLALSLARTGEGAEAERILGELEAVLPGDPSVREAREAAVRIAAGAGGDGATGSSP